MNKRKQLCRKGISVLLCCFTAVSVCLAAVYAEPDTDLKVGSGYQYPKTEVMQLDIVMKPKDFWKMSHVSVQNKEDAHSERLDDIKKKYDAFVSVNGSEFQEVCVRLRGSSSLDIGLIKPIKRLPFEICFDHVNPNGAYNGNPSLKLISCDSPAGLFTELIAMETFRFMGIPTPEITPAFVRINDQDFGVYLAVEDTNAAFVHKYYDGTGSLYSVKHVNDDEVFYESVLFEVLKIKVDHGNDTMDQMEKAAAQGKTIEPFLNVDEFLRFLACEAFIYDLDGVCQMHNFILYDDHGRFEMIPWDKDLVFQVFSETEIRSLSQYNNRLSPALSQITQLPENRAALYRYIQSLNDTFLDPATFLPWLQQIIRAVCPYMQRDAAFSRKSDHIYEDLTTKRNLFNGTEGNLLLSFKTIHEQIQLQLQDETATYHIPSNCTVSDAKNSIKEPKKDYRYGRQEVLRICAGYWKLSRQVFWQEYGMLTIYIGGVFILFLCISIISTHISKIGARSPKTREGPENE